MRFLFCCFLTLELGALVWVSARQPPHVMTQSEFMDTPAPAQDIDYARRWCASAVAADKKMNNGQHVDSVNFNGRHFMCNPFYQN